MRRIWSINCNCQRAKCRDSEIPSSAKPKHRTRIRNSRSPSLNLAWKAKAKGAPAQRNSLIPAWLTENLPEPTSVPCHKRCSTLLDKSWPPFGYGRGGRSMSDSRRGRKPMLASFQDMCSCTPHFMQTPRNKSIAPCTICSDPTQMSCVVTQAPKSQHLAMQNLDPEPRCMFLQCSCLVTSPNVLSPVRDLPPDVNLISNSIHEPYARKSRHRLHAHERARSPNGPGLGSKQMLVLSIF